MPIMRKDVKLGFAIGGVLLAVLIVYVLVVPGSDKAVPPQSKGPEAENVLGGGAPPSTAVDTGAHNGPSTAPITSVANGAGTGTPPNGTEHDVFAKGSGDAAPNKPQPKWDQ